MATQLFDKSQAFFGELVPLARTPLVRDQAGQTLGLESKLSLVKRWARKPKRRGRPGDGLCGWRKPYLRTKSLICRDLRAPLPHAFFTLALSNAT